VLATELSWVYSAVTAATFYWCSKLKIGVSKPSELF